MRLSPISLLYHYCFLIVNPTDPTEISAVVASALPKIRLLAHLLFLIGKIVMALAPSFFFFFSLEGRHTVVFPLLGGRRPVFGDLSLLSCFLHSQLVLRDRHQCPLLLWTNGRAHSPRQVLLGGGKRLRGAPFNVPPLLCFQTALSLIYGLDRPLVPLLRESKIFFS